MKMAATGAKNQRHNKLSRLVSVVFGRSLNQRVVGSSPTRFTMTNLSPLNPQSFLIICECLGRWTGFESSSNLSTPLQSMM